MINNFVFIDFDGVILDSERLMLERKAYLGLNNHDSKIEFKKYFEYTNNHPEEWDLIIRNAKSINNSVKIIRELEFLKKKIAILTKIHTLNEMNVKVDVLRNKLEIMCPIIFVPPGTEKHQVIVPNNQLLIDDSKKNIDEWIKNGGTGLVFDPLIEKNDSYKVNSLKFLLKR